ncbi:helix-turn-helix transcriptional regulator [Arthrobacter methylotrophus]|uniref:helix-turn-helix transcriptional regulator n=1 Tax=Arthrobacter methylotrophus TaxID=121291 RepID=UPI0031ED2D86
MMVRRPRGNSKDPFRHYLADFGKIVQNRSKKQQIGNIVPDHWRLVEDLAAIAATIRRTRKEAGITQADLADLAGTSERTVRAIETATGNPSLGAVVAVANAVGLHIVAG